MKKLLILALLFFTFSGYAQTREELFSKLNEHYEAGEYIKALPYAQKVLEAVKKELGEYHIDYAVALNDLAAVLTKTGDHKAAITYLLRSADLRKNLLGEAHPDHLQNLEELAAVYSDLGEHLKALEILQQVSTMWKFLEGPSSEPYARAQRNYALRLIDVGKYPEAESVLLEMEKLHRRLYGEQHSEYAVTCNGLGMLYLLTAKFDRSELYFLKVLEFYEARQSTDHVSRTRINLSAIYFNLKQFERARQELLSAKRIRREMADTLSDEYAAILVNLGVTLIWMEEYDEALSTLETASGIKKTIFGSDHPEVANALQSIAGVYHYQGKFDKVEPLLKEVIRIYKKAYGEEHPDYATTINNLAIHYFEKGDFSKTEPLQKEALTIYKKAYGDFHPDYTGMLKNMALLYLRMGKPELAQHYFLQIKGSITRFLSQTFEFLPEQEREDYLHTVSVLDDFNSFLTSYGQASAEMIGASFEQLLYLKSLSLSGAQNLLGRLRKTTDTELRTAFETWLGKKKQLAAFMTKGTADNKNEIEELEGETKRIEKTLLQKSAIFRQEQEAKQVSIRDIQDGMRNDEVVVEFIRYDYYLQDWTDSVYYAAYVLHKDDDVPQFVYLCEEKQLQAIFDSAGKSAVEQAFSFYRGLEKKKGENAGVLGEQLYKIIWAPLEKYLRGKKQVSYSPSGLLYNISLNALPFDSNTLLLDKYLLRQYTSTRLLADRSTEQDERDSSGIVLFGDALFDRVMAGAPKGDKSAVSALSTRGGREKWERLPGTAEEVEKIASFFKEKGFRAISLVKADATEESFKQLNGRSTNILHIATHGFFLPAPTEKKERAILAINNSYAYSENPLVRSGLVFTGANEAWSGKQVTEGEDGIATAYEISQLDLSNTKLVVLSACETALGDIKGSEGVFGLQRAFKMAGVKKMILSLWQVPDKETAELMTTFYSYLLSGNTTESAFAKAQLAMRKKYTPFYWAAFVLVE